MAVLRYTDGLGVRSTAPAELLKLVEAVQLAQLKRPDLGWGRAVRALTAPPMLPHNRGNPSTGGWTGLWLHGTWRGLLVSPAALTADHSGRFAFGGVAAMLAALDLALGIG